MAVNISTPCRLNGQHIILYSGDAQCVGYPCSSPGSKALVYGNMFYFFTMDSRRWANKGVNCPNEDR